jgi:hypothetical protein
MKVGKGYGRRTAAATLALVGLVIVTDPMHVGNPISVAYADTIRSIANVCDWTAVRWDQLSDAEKQAFQTLGWSQTNWEANATAAPASASKNWSELTPEEKNAAQSLGFNEQNWEQSCPSH